jgi:glycosyltransferase involved in cell wall biosynthesis
MTNLCSEWLALSPRMGAGNAGDAPNRVLAGPTGSRTNSAVLSEALPVVLMLGPSREAVSGISTHINQLFGSDLACDHRLVHFQVGSEGRCDGFFRSLLRLAVSPIAFARVLRVTRPAIVHINSAMDIKAFARDAVYLALARGEGRKVVFQVHGGELPQNFLPGGLLGRAVLRRVLAGADVVVLLAEVERRAYEAFAPGLRVEVIANAIEPAAPAELAPGERLHRGYPLRLVCLGRVERVKGVFEAVKALALLRGRGIEARLSVAGNGSDLDELRVHASALGVEDIVEFVGPVFGGRKASLWRDSDVFVFPTYHREGLPYALLEAMQAGAVVVTHPVGAIPDVVSHGRDAVFVPARDPTAVADALQWIHENRECAARLAAAAHQRVVSRYTVSRLAGDFRALYHRS